MSSYRYETMDATVTQAVAKNPPNMATGRHPKRFDKTAAKGPV